MNGFLNLLKPPDMSSAAAVGCAKRALHEKVGHAGTLDPQAAGILPLMVGRASRLFDYLVEKQKTYIAEIAFGAATDTQDAQGKVIQTGGGAPEEAALRAVLDARFTGDLMQVPPAFSAIKQDGRRLYDLARQGKMVTAPARPARIDKIDILSRPAFDSYLLRVTCGRGVYIRTLCHDIGQALDAPAHMRFLLRAQTGVFSLDTAVTLEELTAAAQNGQAERLLLAMDYPLAHLPRADVPQRLAKACDNEKPNQLFGHRRIRSCML